MGRVSVDLSANSIRNAVAAFRRFVDDAIALEWTCLVANPLRNPALVRELPSAHTRAGAGVVIHLEPSIVERLLSAASVPLDRRVLYALGVTSVLRAGELRGLRWCDVDLEGVEIPVARVRRSLALIGPTGYASFKEPKTTNGYRVVPLHGVAIDALRAWKSHGWELWTTKEPTSEDLIFPDVSGKPWRPDDATFLREDLKSR